MLAIILFCVALLGPWVIAAFSNRPDPALVFGIIGWRHKTGKATVIITTVLLGFMLIIALVIFPLRRAQSEKEFAKMEQDVRRAKMEAQRAAQQAEAQHKTGTTNEPSRP